jgi:hypothetical protein
MMELRLVTGKTDMGDAYEEVGDMRLYVMDNGEPMTLAGMAAKGLSFAEAKAAAAGGMKPAIYSYPMIFGTHSKIRIVKCVDDKGKPRSYSAAAIMLPQVQEELEKFYGGTFYVIPSSVHECLTVPERAMSKEDLEDMLNSINHKPLAVGEGEALASKVLMWKPDERRFV